MNVAIIASWYPSSNNTLAGSFIKEQCVAIAQRYKNDEFAVIILGTNNTLSPKRPADSIYNFFSYIFSTIFNNKIFNNLTEYYTPSIVISYRLKIVGRIFNDYILYRSALKSFLRFKNKVGKIDIIHAHVSYPGGYIAYKLSKKFKCPYVLTEHMGPFPFKSYLNGNGLISQIELAFTSATRQVAVSNSLKKDIVSFGLPCSDVIANLVDGDKFYISKSKYSKFTFFTLCGISKQKGIDTLLESISLLNKKYKNNIEFIIGGDGDMLEAYKNQAIKLGLLNIKWLGKIDRNDAPDIFAKSHAYIMLSNHESFGIVYAEAIASGLPIIATKCGGPEDIVNDINGILVDIGDALGTARAIESIYDNYHIYDSLAIRKDFKQRFDKQIFCAKYIKIYKELLNID